MFWLSLAVDESTDTVDTAQLAVFIRDINSNFEITEELLKCVPLTGTTTANDIYSAIEHLIAEYELDWNKFSSATTDGAPAMVGKHSGVVTKLKQKISGNFVGIHCIIHQESLASKHLKIDLVMQPVTKIVNFIRSRGLNRRQLRPTQTGTEWQGILIFTNGHSTVLLQKYDINCYALK